MLRKHERPTRGAIPRNQSRGSWRSPAPFWRGACLLVPTRSSFRDGFPSPSKRCKSRRNSPPGQARQGSTNETKGDSSLTAPGETVVVNAFSSPGRSTDRPGVDGQSHGGIDEMWMRSEPCWPETVLDRNVPLVLAGYPRPVRHLESTQIATGVAGRPHGEEGAADRDSEHAVGRYT